MTKLTNAKVYYYSLGSEVEATDDLILSSDFFIDRTVDSLTLNERDMDANDSPRRKRSSISIFTLSGLLGLSYQHMDEEAIADSKEVHEHVSTITFDNARVNKIPNAVVMKHKRNKYI
uniref:Uncharacterized protein n=1 Tax=Glossina pallidipes TaxID=7398 RepID=A0A1A9Z283_GLOPL